MVLNVNSSIIHIYDHEDYLHSYFPLDSFNILFSVGSGSMAIRGHRTQKATSGGYCRGTFLI